MLSPPVPFPRVKSPPWKDTDSVESQCEQAYRAPVRTITYLEHEVGDNTVEAAALVVKRLSALSGALLSSAESTEVLGGLRHDVIVQLE